MPEVDISRMLVVLGASILVAPFIVLAQRRLFAIFLVEGAELLGDVSIAKKDALTVGTLLAKLDVLVLLVAWLGLYTCRCFDQSWYLWLGIALTGVLVAIVVTTLIVHNTVRRLNGPTTLVVGLMVFAGGNLPLIVVAMAAIAFWR